MQKFVYKCRRLYWNCKAFKFKNFSTDLKITVCRIGGLVWGFDWLLFDYLIDWYIDLLVGWWRLSAPQVVVYFLSLTSETHSDAWTSVLLLLFTQMARLVVYLYIFYISNYLSIYIINKYYLYINTYTDIRSGVERWMCLSLLKRVYVSTFKMFNLNPYIRIA